MNSFEDNKPYHLRQLPHSCGEICARSLTFSSNFWKQEADTNVNSECKHKCLIMCHPGPCQPCDALVNRSCNCGKSKFQVKCSSSKIPECDRKCGNYLNCKLHICERVCHSAECKPCDVDIEQSNYLFFIETFEGGAETRKRNDFRLLRGMLKMLKIDGISRKTYILRKNSYFRKIKL